MRKTIQKRKKLPIRTGDRVKIIAGKHRNEQGIILRVLPSVQRAFVEGINLVARHLKPSAKNPKGSIVRKEASLHISNLMLVDPGSGLPTRIGRKYNGAGKLQRYAKKTGNFIENGQA
ncbi:MAG: 50S ribosomal protein L24 [Candidatus Cardinium sp.]|uniref:Large ribosomal subunit protein uL24 n=1 Tax=Candidatus Cardinium hertigii TaxID=247481 RepID=A0A2Z3L810_9BACT|nr:50S ribosomal protein L24 [Candidatus Cardinium hertigii]AWN81753.1 50S ribosomal protein L24 [Candidatus Cardinium hertigii]MDD9139601.1 50S ribosomal protein L24 [Candidatus Cardinium sp.]